jgi:GST-like protein
LEESGLPPEPVSVATSKGGRFGPAFPTANPNAKTPAIVDGDVAVLDGNAILLCQAQKTGQFQPEDPPAARGQLRRG